MIPSEIIIDGVPYTVATCDTMPENEWGETDKKKCRILLDPDMATQVMESTFWHELIHALFAVRDIKLHDEDKPDDREEEVATVLGPALHAFFMQNAEITWLHDPPGD